jgi:triphosphoribosyl-dephospho-CoA synthase
MSAQVLRRDGAVPWVVANGEARLADGAAIARLALHALYKELCASPKPGLVDLVDQGSHADMDARTFMRSLFSLRQYFRAIAQAGAQSAAFPVLQSLGMGAERRMLAATGGVNTHRGAIFALGLLVAAAGLSAQTPDTPRVAALGDVVRIRWGRAIARSLASAPASHGVSIARRYGAGGARAEAAAGFPHLFEVGLPAFRAALARTGDANRAAVQALFSLMALLYDTNLLYRGGRRGLAYAQAAARAFVAAGGVYRTDWREQALSLHQEFVARRLSPGGSADLLAATLFVFTWERARGA